MRALTSDMLTQIAAGRVTPAFFVQVAFQNETIYIWSGFGPITWNSQTWQGVGWLGQISPVIETTDVTAQNVTFTLSGIPSELAGDAINYVRLYSEVQVWFGFIDGSRNVIADPSRCFDGHLDVPTMTDASDTCTLTVTAENPLVDLNGAPNRRFTDCDQQLEYPGDIGFSQVSLLQNALFLWPTYP
jgi:hypothetical protein